MVDLERQILRPEAVRKQSGMRIVQAVVRSAIVRDRHEAAKKDVNFYKRGIEADIFDPYSRTFARIGDGGCVLHLRDSDRQARPEGDEEDR